MRRFMLKRFILKRLFRTFTRTSSFARVREGTASSTYEKIVVNGRTVFEARDGKIIGGTENQQQRYEQIQREIADIESEIEKLERRIEELDDQIDAKREELYR